VVTYVLATLIDLFIGLRVSENEELVGLDISQHAESV
jgi:Amt family ammonium transporter